MCVPWRQMDSRSMATLILKRGARWRWVVRITSRPHYPRKKTPRHPLNRKLGGQKSRSGLSWEWKVIYHCRNCATIPPRSSSPGPNRYTEHSITAATSCVLLCFNDLIFFPENLPWIVPLDTVFRFTIRQYVMPHVLAVGNLGCDSVTYVLYYLTFLTLL
jgi:hypothetical protein